MDLQGLLKTDIDYGRIKTGVLPIDIILGGGLGKGTLMEIYSPPGVGKSTLSLHLCSSLIKQGYRCAYLDTEKAVDETLLKNMKLDEVMGSDTDSQFLFLRPSTYEEVETLMDLIVGLKGKDEGIEPYQFVVIDSITFLLPEKLLNESVLSNEIGLDARIQSILVKKLKVQAEYSKCCILLVNQMRYKRAGGFAFVQDASGGNAIKFAADVRLKISNKDYLLREELTPNGPVKVKYGSVNEMVAIKNKLARPHIPIPLPVVYGRGVTNLMFLQLLLVKQGFISIGRAGYRKINFPGLEETKVRGDKETWLFIKEHYEHIVEYLEENGYFELVQEHTE